jgi:hypothetical protein
MMEQFMDMQTSKLEKKKRQAPSPDHHLWAICS